jgi:type VI secretion system secreted protein VgrG
MKDRSVSVQGKSEQTVKAEHIFKAKKIDITAEDELTITVGSAKLVMKKDGSILLDGKDVDTKASGKVNIKASGDIIVKGSAVKEN